MADKNFSDLRFDVKIFIVLLLMKAFIGPHNKPEQTGETEAFPAL